MGDIYETTCIDCEWKFDLAEFGGMQFKILRCNLCPKTKEARWENERNYKCKCGGKFSEKALPRCPKCSSTNISKGKLLMMFD